jgi:hypothetical protein
MTIYVLEAAEDTNLVKSKKHWNYGVCSEFSAGDSYGDKHRSLIRFPLDDIPPDVITVTSAVLSLRCKGVLDDTGRLITVYRSLVQWYEGIRCAQYSGSNDGSNWNMRNDNSDGQMYWVGGINTGGVSGEDWYATKTDDTEVSVADARYEWDVKADIEDFLSGDEENFGWFLIGIEGVSKTAKWFDSCQAEVSENRPILTLDLSYTYGTIPAGVADCCDGSNYLLMERKGIVP